MLRIISKAGGEQCSNGIVSYNNRSKNSKKEYKSNTMFEPVTLSCNINCLKIIIKLNNVFGLVPHYNFNKGSIKKSYSFLWVLIHLATILYYIYDCISLSIDPNIKGTTVTEVPLSFLPAMSIFKTFSLDSQIWKQYFNNTLDLEKYFKNKLPNDKHHSMVAKFYSTLLLTHLIIIMIILFTVWHKNPFDTAFLAVIYIWETYNLVIFNLFINAMAMFLLVSYKNLNELLMVDSSEQILIEIGRVFGHLHQTNELFNLVFGQQLLLVTVYVVLDILDLLNMWMLYFLIDGHDQLPLYIYEEFGYFLLLWMSYSCIVFSCDLTKKEAKYFTQNCHKIHLNQPTNRKLVDLARTSEILGPVFTCSDYVPVDRQIFSSIANVVLAYLIVIINFNNSKA
ncbi:unnamed protein product [Ceutorhynchus assimilis]|uniref:Gustatory receptor n=1 Tax=Ceutorhynchus assimilis TaxID=467358 RepID=A0A9N9MFB7_9CUCU|nr:unnamed protein product [Ceutorhynchus assimilis]